MSLQALALETLEIVDGGAYDSPRGGRVEFGAVVRDAIARTQLYTPSEVAALVPAPGESAGETHIEVTTEGTVGALLRLAAEGVDDVCVLNFASARNPGGGFLGGARAQEEELCRCSALYRCLEPQVTYYEANRAQRSAVYTDHLLYSPRVPFFRDEARDPLGAPVLASVITSPAPNTGAVRANSPAELPEVRRAFYRRSAQILAVAAAHHHRQIVLGAWGCGAFQGDPELAADAFGAALEHQFRGRFARVVFAILVKARRDTANVDAFRARFAGATG